VSAEHAYPNKLEPWVKLLTAILVLIGTAFGVYKGCASFHAASSAQPANTEPTTRSFSGIVVDQNGKPVSGANVQVVLDQQTPVPYTSDSLGAFELEVPTHTSTIRISVYKEGFKARSLLDSPQRTGPEVIVLTSTTPNVTLKAPNPIHDVPHRGKTAIVIGHDNEVNQ
jgi:hypothetical protein